MVKLDKIYTYIFEKQNREIIFIVNSILFCFTLPYTPFKYVFQFIIYYNIL